MIYLTGIGMEKNQSLALKWFLEAAKLGYPQSQLVAGRMYAYGIGTYKDCDKAKEFLSKALASGEVPEAKRFLEML